MGSSSLYGNWGRYNQTPPVLADKSDVALQLTSTGATKVSSALGVGTASPALKKKYGNPARYNVNEIELSDGDYCALQVDVSGSLIINVA